MSLRSLLASLAALTALLATPALAHEFIVKPAKTTVPAGESLPFTVVSSHVFMVSEELENAPDVKVQAVDGSGAKDVALTSDPKAFTFEGKAAFTKPGYAMLVGHRLPQVWSSTPEGIDGRRQGRLSQCPVLQRLREVLQDPHRGGQAKRRLEEVRRAEA